MARWLCGSEPSVGRGPSSVLLKQVIMATVVIMAVLTGCERAWPHYMHAPSKLVFLSLACTRGNGGRSAPKQSSSKSHALRHGCTRVLVWCTGRNKERKGVTQPSEGAQLCSDQGTGTSRQLCRSPGLPAWRAGEKPTSAQPVCGAAPAAPRGFRGVGAGWEVQRDRSLSAPRAADVHWRLDLMMTKK